MQRPRRPRKRLAITSENRYTQQIPRKKHQKNPPRLADVVWFSEMEDLSGQTLMLRDRSNFWGASLLRRASPFQNTSRIDYLKRPGKCSHLQLGALQFEKRTVEGCDRDMLRRGGTLPVVFPEALGQKRKRNGCRHVPTFEATILSCSKITAKSRQQL